MPEKILVIKHGALGDWILMTGAFKLIRIYYPLAHISILIDSQYASLALSSSWFNQVLIDDRKGIFNTLKVLFMLKKNKFTHVFDLQRSQRTALYYFFFKKDKLFWSGKVRGCKGAFVDDPNKHLLDRVVLQLVANHIHEFPFPDISWLKATSDFIIPKKPYALIIPGGSKHRPKKKWTPQGYLEFIEWINKKNIHCIIVGTEIDRVEIDIILKDKKNRSLEFYPASLGELATLAREAYFVLGGVTGPIHIASITNADCLVLGSSKETSIQKDKPFGQRVRMIQVDDLSALTAKEVIVAASEMIANKV